MNPKTELFSRLLETLARNEWHFREHTAIHISSGTELWTANGWLFVDTHPVGAGFGPIQRWRLHRALQQAKARSHLENLIRRR